MMPEDLADATMRRRRAVLRRVLVVVASLLLAAAVVVAVTRADDTDVAPPATPGTTSPADPSPGATDDSAGPAVTRDDALRSQLAALPAVVMEMIGRSEPVGTVWCGINVLGGTADDSRLYVWLACGDFTTGPDAELLSGSSESAVLTVTGRGADIHVTGVEFPRQQHLDADITRMFPPTIADQVRVGDLPVTPTLDELLEQARRAVSQTSGDGAGVPGSTG